MLQLPCALSLFLKKQAMPPHSPIFLFRYIVAKDSQTAVALQYPPADSSKSRLLLSIPIATVNHNFIFLLTAFLYRLGHKVWKAHINV